MALAVRNSVGTRAALSVARPRPATLRVVCQAHQQKPEKPEDHVNKFALPVATLVASALVCGAIVPEEALAAKSGGRVGGSSFKSRRVQTSAAPRTTVNNVVVAPGVAAPPVYAGYGYGSPFGFSIMPTFVMPFPFFGGLLQIFLLMAVVSVVFNVIRGIAAASSSNNNKKDDGWGDL